MQNEYLGYLFCVIMTIVLFGVIWGLSRFISIFTDRILPDETEENA